MDAGLTYVRRVVPETATAFIVPSFPLSGAVVDLYFANSQYYDVSFGPGSDPSNLTANLSISRASIGYAETATGMLTQFPVDTLRVTDRGLLVEGSRTNVVLFNRDLTDISWTKTNITAAKDQAGLDGVENSASSIIATAGNGTVLQAITLASSTRYQTAYVKRLIGSGTINMTMDNGSTWTVIDVTRNWTRLAIPSQTLVDPTVGFRIVTNGDKIAVDFVQNENGTFPTSPILTTTTSAARAADSITPIGTLNTTMTGLSGSVVIEVQVNYPIDFSAQNAGLMGRSGGAEFSLRNSENGNISSVVGGVYLQEDIGGAPASFYTGIKAGHSWSASGRSVAAYYASPIYPNKFVSDNVATTYTPNPLIGLSGGFYTWGYLRRLSWWNSRLADLILLGLTTP